MKKAVVTGISSGIGEAIGEVLLSLGYEVVGVSRNTPKINHPHLTFIACDLSKEREVLELCQQLSKEEIFILINCAGSGVFAPHEELDATTITSMSMLNLTTPMLLTHAMLRSLKKSGGYLINITSIEALRASKFAALYSATKAGLRAFSEALFEETRKSDLSITTINPDMTQSGFYKDLRFDVSKDEDAKLLASDIAEAVKHILTMRKGAVVSDYTIRSLHFGIEKKSKR